MSHLSIDTAWCPVCDRAIVPKRIQVPILDPSTTRKRFREQHGRHSKKVPPLPVRTRTVISQEPLPYYCSDQCRIHDLQADLDASLSPLHHLSPQLLDDGLPLRVPHNSPSSSLPPPSPLLPSSSETDTDDSADSYSPTKVLRSLPPLRRKPSKKASDSRTPSLDFQGGVMMAARRIQAAFASASDSSLLGSSRKQIVIPGWTDGDRTEWRASVYLGTTANSKAKYTSIDASHCTGGSFSAQAARRVAGEEEPPQATIPPGNSAPQSSIRPPPLSGQFKPAFRRSDSSAHIASSPKDIDIPSPPEESVHPLLSNSSLRGKLLIPQLSTPSAVPSRSESSSDLTVSSTTLHRSSQTTFRAAPSHAHSVHSTYPLLLRPSSKDRRLRDVWVPSPTNKSRILGLGEGKWEKQEIVTQPAEPKRLFTFAH